jgi:hypothetical protein
MPRLDRHPELGHLSLLAHQLELLTASLTLVHTNGGQPEPLTHHARAMVQVVRVLQLQIDTYRELLSVQSPSKEPKPRRRS